MTTKRSTTETNTEMSKATSSAIFVVDTETTIPTPERLFTKVFLENFDHHSLFFGYGHHYNEVKTNINIWGISYETDDPVYLLNIGGLPLYCNISLSTEEIAKLGNLPELKDIPNVRRISIEEKLKYEDSISILNSSIKKLKIDLSERKKRWDDNGGWDADVAYRQLHGGYTDHVGHREMYDMVQLENKIKDCKKNIARYRKIFYLSEISSEALDMLEDLCKVLIIGLIKCAIEYPLYHRFYKILEFSEVLTKKLGNCSKTYKKKSTFNVGNWEDLSSPNDKSRQLTKEQEKIRERLVKWMSEDL